MPQIVGNTDILADGPLKIDLPARYALSERVRNAPSVKLPKLLSMAPGIKLYPYQVRGIAWMYFAQRGILADATGLGKTVQALGLTCLLKDQHEPYRTVILVPKPARQQWVDEARKFTTLRIATAFGSKSERTWVYGTNWEVLITTYPILMRDLSYLQSLDFHVLVFDEASSFRNHDTRTAECVRALSRNVTRVALLDATPVQNALHNLHSLLEAMRMPIFGPLPAFERRYVRRAASIKRIGRSTVATTEIIGYKNMEEFRDRVAPLILRRRPNEVEAELPDLVLRNVWLDMPVAQRVFYDQARQGVITLYEQNKRAQMRAYFHHMQYAMDTTWPFVQNQPGAVVTSVKLDWVMRALLGDMVDQKVVIFSKFKTAIQDLVRRMAAAKIGFVVYTGDEDDSHRNQALDAFNNDPQCHVLIGTSALERSLNLQQAGYLICINQIFNPKRMEQLAGRIKRIGSKHASAIVVNLLIADSVEERLYRLMSERAAVSDFVLNETSELWEGLSDAQLMAFIQG